LFFVSTMGFSQPFDGFIPEGTVHVSGNIFIDRTEVSNVHWLEYEHFVKSRNGPDSLFTVQTIVTKNYRPNYLRDAGFRNYPVVGISQIQAEGYCAWKSIIVNALLKIKHERQVLTNLYQVSFRLPTENEWELAARLSDTISYSKPRAYSIEAYLKLDDPTYALTLIPDSVSSTGKLKKVIARHKKNDSIPAFKLNREYPWFALIQDRLPQSVYFPEEFESTDNLRLPLNMIGNVSELVAKKGVTKGGDWRHNLAVSFPSKKIFIDATKAYDWVGFRCICVVREIE